MQGVVEWTINGSEIKLSGDEFLEDNDEVKPVGFYVAHTRRISA